MAKIVQDNVAATADVDNAHGLTKGNLHEHCIRPVFLKYRRIRYFGKRLRKNIWAVITEVHNSTLTLH